MKMTTNLCLLEVAQGAVEKVIGDFVCGGDRGDTVCNDVALVLEGGEGRNAGELCNPKAYLLHGR